MCELLSNNSLFVGQLYEDKSLALRARDLTSLQLTSSEIIYNNSLLELFYFFRHETELCRKKSETSHKKSENPFTPCPKLWFCNFQVKSNNFWNYNLKWKNLKSAKNLKSLMPDFLNMVFWHISMSKKFKLFAISTMHFPPLIKCKMDFFLSLG